MGEATITDSKIELRLSNVDPPAPEPKRTIYRDIVNLPNPVKLGLTIRYFNHDDVGLYFQITGSGAGYTFGTVNLGLLASGTDTYRNLDEFASRAKPSPTDLPNGEKEENITLILKAYTDSGYTNLKWTFERVVTVHWINSADPSFTLDVLNNFDDGTTQGWAAVNETANTSSTVAVVTDYVLSAPYSLRMRSAYTGLSYPFTTISRLYKSFTTPNRDIIYAIFDVRVSRAGGYDTGYLYELKALRNGTLLIQLGVTLTGADRIPHDKWIRMVVPLPKNVTVELRITLKHSHGEYYGSYSDDAYVWLDDFKIISK